MQTTTLIIMILVAFGHVWLAFKLRKNHRDFLKVRADFLEVQAEYERLLLNHQAVLPIQQAIEAAMAAQQPGESGCVTITVQQIDPSEAPSIGLPRGKRLH